MTITATRLSSPPATDAFLVVEENRFAVAALERLKTGTTGKLFKHRQPLVYLWGPSGVGKSHLIEQLLKSEWPHRHELKIEHLTASDFAARLAEASVAKTIHEFQEYYKTLDLFICEDLQALSRRKETQQQLSVIVDEILATGGRVIFSARVSPGQLKQISSRLTNRCHGGICASIAAPDQQSREVLLAHFAASRQLPLSTTAATLLAEHLPVSPRELQATITQLETWANWKKRILDTAAVREWLTQEPPPPSLTASQVAKKVARHFGVTLKEIRSASRQQELVIARQAAMFLVRELTEEPLTEIARYFTRKNHTTVLHACNRIEQLEQTHPTLTQELNQLRESLLA